MADHNDTTSVASESLQNDERPPIPPDALVIIRRWEAQIRGEALRDTFRALMIWFAHEPGFAAAMERREVFTVKAA